MVHVLGDFPELSFAIPFLNGSFGKWTDTLPDQWPQIAGSPAGSYEKIYPGFDASRAIQISETGVDITTAANTLGQVLECSKLAIPDGQSIRLACCVLNNISGYGDGYAVAKVSNYDAGPANYSDLVSLGQAQKDDWAIITADSSVTIDTDKDYLVLKFETRSYGGSTNPANYFDCLVAHYGLTTASRLYTFTHKPTLQGLSIKPFYFGKKDRLAGGRQRRVDPSGGAVKWRVTMPFHNVPDSFVETLFEFFNRNKGVGSAQPEPLCLRHNLSDPAATHIDGEDFLKRPPWIVCNILEEEFPFVHAGTWLGAKVYNGVLTFEEI